MSCGSTTFSKRGAAVAVEGRADDVAAWMVPYVDVATAAGPPAPWTVLRRAPADPGDDWAAERIPASGGEPARCFWFHRSRPVLAIEPVGERWEAYSVMRAVRSLLKWQLWDADLAFLHGASVAFGPTAVAFLGPKGAGKTSSTLAALAIGAGLVSNDDLTVRLEDGVAVSLGWPRAVNLKPGSLAALPPGAVRFPIGRVSHPAHRDLPAAVAARDVSELADTGLRGIQLLPGELAAATGTTPVPEAALAAVFFVRHAPAGATEPVITPMGPEEAARQLAANQLAEPETLEPYWAPRFVPPTADQRAATLRSIAERVPCYWLDQTLATLLPAAEAVRELARRAPAAGPPVEVVDPDPAWPAAFAAEHDRLLAGLPGCFVAVEHVGSTAVPGLAAKPVIDIMASVRTLDEGRRAVPLVEALGYRFVPDAGLPGRLFFAKDEAGRRTHHLHVVEHATLATRNQILLRDHLRADAAARDRYAARKRELAARYPGDRRAYTRGKTWLLRELVAEARRAAGLPPVGAAGDAGDVGDVWEGG